jgi:hypothetical protein
MNTLFRSRLRTAVGAAILVALPVYGGGLAGDVNRSGAIESGDRGVITPSAGGDHLVHHDFVDARGQAVTPSLNDPLSVSESAPAAVPRGQSASVARGNSQALPNPQTPTSVSESAPSAIGGDPTRLGRELQPSAPVGATR